MIDPARRSTAGRRPAIHLAISVRDRRRRARRAAVRLVPAAVFPARGRRDLMLILIGVDVVLGPLHDARRLQPGQDEPAHRPRRHRGAAGRGARLRQLGDVRRRVRPTSCSPATASTVVAANDDRPESLAGATPPYDTLPLDGPRIVGARSAAERRRSASGRMLLAGGPRPADAAALLRAVRRRSRRASDARAPRRSRRSSCSRPEARTPRGRSDRRRAAATPRTQRWRCLPVRGAHRGLRRRRRPRDAARSSASSPVNPLVALGHGARAHAAIIGARFARIRCTVPGHASARSRRSFAPPLHALSPPRVARAGRATLARRRVRAGAAAAGGRRRRVDARRRHERPDDRGAATPTSAATRRRSPS